MLNFKIPIYTGITGFIIILFINIIKGNSILVILLRSFFYGTLVFGVFFCVIFIFQKYLNLSFDTDETDNFKNEEESPNVDIMAGEESLDDNIIEDKINNIDSYTDADIDTETDDHIDENKNIDINKENNEKEVNVQDNFDNEISSDNFKDNINEEIITEKNIEKDDSAENNNVKTEDLKGEIKTVDEFSDNNQPDLELENDNTHELDELSLDDEKYIEDNEYAGSKNEGSGVKEKLGMDVSYEELAKAIRTKLKRDED